MKKEFDYISNSKKVQEYLLKHINLLNMDSNECKNEIKLQILNRLNIVSKKLERYKKIKVNSIEDIVKFPILTKDEIRKNSEELYLEKNINFNEVEVRKTSGSTGQPIEIIKSHDLFNYYSAISINELINHGWTPLDVYFVLHGAGIGNLSPGIETENLANLLSDVNPNIFSCYPSYILNMIHNPKLEKKLKNIPLKFICTHSEQSSAHEKSEIESYFKCKVYDEYGATEVGPIAVQCRNNHYHIIEDNVYIEILDKNENKLKNGEVGKIIVTDLRNELMGLIRYDIGDYGSIEETGSCDCEWKNFKVLKSLEGRIDDSFKMPSGRIIPTGQMIAAISLNERESIKEWQVIQEKEDLFTINYVKGEKYDSNSINKLKSELMNLFQEEVIINTKELDSVYNLKEKRKVYKSLIK